MNEKPRQTASDFDPEVLKLFDQYVHGQIDRRGFLQSAARFAAGIAGASALLTALSPKFAAAQQVAADDARLKTEYLEFDSPHGYGKARGYLARPKAAEGALPVVLVVHENRGLNPHIEDIARRIALENFIAFAPDALFPLGGYPGDEDKARALFATLDQGKTQQDFIAAAGLLQKIEGGNARLGVVGFCYGGGMSNFLATRLPELSVAVPYYGPAAALEDVPKIKAELQLHFAETDERVNTTWPPYEAALKEAGVKYEAFHYPGTQHGFNNDTTPRYDPGRGAPGLGPHHRHLQPQAARLGRRRARFTARARRACRGPAGISSVRRRLAELAVLAAAAVVAADAAVFRIVRFLAIDAEAHARDGLAPRLGNLRVAFLAARQARALGNAAARALDRVLDGRVDLVLHRAVAGPSCRHRPPPHRYCLVSAVCPERSAEGA